MRDRERPAGGRCRAHACPIWSSPFSGLRRRLRYRLRDLGDGVTEQDRADLAAAFQAAVIGALMEKLELALRRHPVDAVVLCGGVAANGPLREATSRVAASLGARVTLHLLSSVPTTPP